MGRVLPYTYPMGRGEGRELPCIDPMGRRGGGEGTPVCSPYGEGGGEGTSMYRPHGEERRWGGHSHMQPLRGGGEGRELPCIDPMGKRGDGEGTPICSPYGEGGGEGTYMYRPYGEERKWGGYSRMQSLWGGGRGGNFHV